MGINDTGELNFEGVGISLAEVGDGIIPGCPCEGWGVAVNGTISGGVSQQPSMTVGNLTLSPFTSTASTATSVVTLTSLPTLSVTQAYAPSASSALFQNTVTITNTGAAVTDLLYTRVMDWDIPPTTFSEMVTIKGVGATALVLSHDNGFANVDPLAVPLELTSGTTNVDFTDSGPNDHGAYFKFNFGSLAADSSKTFNIFYGAAGSETAALAALGTVGAEVYSFGQSDGSVTGSDFTTGTPGTFIFGFAGVGGTPLPPPDGTVPEPSTLLLSLLGLGMSALRLRKRKTS
jgi:type IV pilus assembly protein PilY1